MEYLNEKKLRDVCLRSIPSFSHLGKTYETKDGILIHQDNGSKILAVAHLDTVLNTKHFYTVHHNGEVGIINAQLDDRLGVYVLLHVLPKLGLKYDLLLTEGEEVGRSTASHFRPPRQYNWMFQFDRAGTDVVLYDYECPDLIDRVQLAGGMVGVGSFSDIVYLDDLGCRGLNWGVGYEDNHSINSYALWSDVLMQVGTFVNFYKENADTFLPFTEKDRYKSWRGSYRAAWEWDDVPQRPMFGKNFIYEAESDTWVEDNDDWDLECPYCAEEDCLGVSYCTECNAPFHNNWKVFSSGICDSCEWIKHQSHRMTDEEFYHRDGYGG